MNVHPHEGELHRHFDGELPARDSWEIEGHLRECATCAAEYDRIRQMVDRVGELPEAIEPPIDLWKGIAARIGSEQQKTDELARRRKNRDRAVRTAVIVGWLSAVAAALVLGVGLGRIFPERATPLAAGAALESGSPATPSTETVLASYQEPQYEDAVAELELLLAEMRAELEPETVRVVEENLAIIDGAIEEARQALLADPANQQLHRHLSTNMQMKLRLLRTVTGALATT